MTFLDQGVTYFVRWAPLLYEPLMCLSIRPKKGAFIRPLPGDWDTVTLGHWDTGHWDSTITHHNLNLGLTEK